MQTLSFKEYREMKRFLGQAVDPNLAAELDRYILEGGFPKALDYPKMADKRAYVGSVIKEIFEKDIRRRVKVKNVSVFNQVRDYVINNFGATTSLTNIQSDLERQGVRIKRETLNRYLQILEDAKIISKCARFDMKSRKSLKGEQKYYLADLSFYFALNTDNRINYGPVLENIVYCYARSLGYEVSVGRIGKLECDFVMRSPEMEYAYVQVAMTIMNDRKTEDSEYRPLEQIRDNWPKFVITRGDPIQHRGGIVHENVTELVGEGRIFSGSAAGGKTMIDIEIRSLPDYLEQVFANKREGFYHEVADLRIMFRGQANLEWAPLPATFRTQDDFLNEHFYIREYERQMPGECAGKSGIEILIDAQHYGIPTRLLDVTTNALVALYFSCGEAETEDEDGKVRPSDGVVIQFQPAGVFMYFYPSCVAYAEYVRRYKNGIHFPDSWREGLIEAVRQSDGRFSCNARSVVEHMLSERAGSFFILPKYSNDRIVSQQGHFFCVQPPL